jgi:hypothetical protein
MGFQSFTKFYLFAQKKKYAKVGQKVSLADIKYNNTTDKLALLVREHR